MCVLSNRDLSMAGFITTDCETKKAMVAPWDWRKERKTWCSKCGAPASNYSFIAVIPENNISYIAVQHEQTWAITHTYMHTSENLGGNQNNISIRFFHGEYHQEIKVYIYMCVSCPIGIYQWQASWPLIVEKKQLFNHGIGERKETWCSKCGASCS